MRAVDSIRIPVGSKRVAGIPAIYADNARSRLAEADKRPRVSPVPAPGIQEDCDVPVRV